MSRKKREMVDDVATSKRQKVATGKRRDHGKDAKVIYTLSDRRTSNVQRKPVFRPVLSSPFAADWPAVNPADASTILHTLITLIRLPPVQKCFERIDSETPRDSARKTRQKNERRRMRLLLSHLNIPDEKPLLVPGVPESSKNLNGKQKECPAFLCGINAVTRSLETSVSMATGQADPSSTPLEKVHRPSLILVCLGDLAPPSLASHLPLLVATYNAMCGGASRLIRLPSGSEQALSEAVRLRRCSVLSVDFACLRREDEAVTNAVSGLVDMMEKCKIQPMRLKWMEDASTFAIPAKAGSGTRMSLEEPRVKHLRSSRPADINARKAATKDRRRLRKAARNSTRI